MYTPWNTIWSDQKRRHCLWFRKMFGLWPHHTVIYVSICDIQCYTNHTFSYTWAWYFLGSTEANFTDPGLRAEQIILCVALLLVNLCYTSCFYTDLGSGRKSLLMAKLCEKEVEVAANNSQAKSIIDTACTAPPLITNYIKKRLGIWPVPLRLQNK
jgi:hypothetical protein